MNYTTPTPDQCVSADNSAAIWEWQGKTKVRIDGITFGYLGDPATPKMMLIEISDPKDNYQVVRRYPITTGGPGPLVTGIETQLNQKIKVTLPASGTAGVIGVLNIEGFQRFN